MVNKYLNENDHILEIAGGFVWCYLANKKLNYRKTRGS